jgi:biopolymer transport protein ExbB
MTKRIEPIGMHPSRRAVSWLVCIGALCAVAAASARAQQPPSFPVAGISQLPHDLTPWSMFVSADGIVRGVILGLAFASLVTWTVFIAKSSELLYVRRTLRRSLTLVSEQRSLAQAAIAFAGRRGILPALIDAAVCELELSAGIAERSGIKERVATRLARLEVAAGRNMNRGTGLLATIGATAPFIGLFGTVWGIMNSFVGISKAQTTNLAVVAPGIAEALFATAFGLYAAIPAVIIYNYFARSIGAYRALVGDASAQVLSLASRQLDHAVDARPMPLAAE